MICKAYRSQVSPDKLDKLIKIIKEQRTPLISKREGFKGTYLLTKPNGEMVELTFWEKEEQAMAWWECPEHKELGDQVKPLAAFGPFTTVIQDVFDVQDVGSLGS